MRSLILSALLILTLSLSVAAQARVETPCVAFGRICGCPSYRARLSPDLSSPTTDRMHADPLDG